MKGRETLNPYLGILNETGHFTFMLSRQSETLSHILDGKGKRLRDLYHLSVQLYFEVNRHRDVLKSLTSVWLGVCLWLD